MSPIDSAVGIDPGPATGICLLDYDHGQLIGRTVLQSEGATAAYVLKGLLLAYHGGGFGTPRLTMGKRTASVEQFRNGASAGARGRPADVTRQLVMEMAEVLEMFGYFVNVRPAGDVKPWATNKRLVAAGIVKDAKSFHGDLDHAYDAARHCLYGAHDAGITPDPLIGTQRKALA